MNIGIMGGTFNPPHKGHLAAANYTREQLDLHKVIFVPNHIPPHKRMSMLSATPQQRIEMTRLAAKEIPLAEVSDIEVSRGGKSYMVDTMEALQEKYLHNNLWLIVGTDMLLSMQTWKEPERLLLMCSVAVVARSENDRQSIALHTEYLRNRYHAQIELIDCPALSISSSRAREVSSTEELEKLVPQSVYQYILDQGLYCDPKKQGNDI